MLISHKYRFIFIHIYKNAGTSIRHALLPFAAESCLHFLLIKLSGKFNHPLPDRYNPEFMDGHSTASQIIQKIGRDQYDSYFTFAFVRNPWDWQVSLYNYMRANERHHQHDLGISFEGFDDYIRWRCASEVRLQKSFIFSSENEQLVSYIGRYENIDSDFSYVCQRIGVQTSLPRLNVTRTKPYQSYYTPETTELVRRAFWSDIQLFDYDFE